MNLKRKIAGILGSVAVVASLAVVGAPTAQAAPPCVGTWTIGIGGLNDNESRVWDGKVNQRVGYFSWDTRGGVNELNRLIRDHRRACPGDYIKALGYSGGAAALHVWATENGGTIGGRTSIVVIADPKRSAGPGGPGFAQTDFPFNFIPTLAGANDNFGGLPRITICRDNDHICNSASNWDGYLNRGAHAAYDFNPNSYPNGGNYRVYLPAV